MSSNHHHHHNNQHPIQSHVRHLYLNKKMSDFNFIVGQTQTIIPGHKFLFSIISPVFYKMFYQNEILVACIIDNNHGNNNNNNSNNNNNNNNNNSGNNNNNSGSNNNNCNNDIYITNINYFSFIEFLKYIYFSEIFVTQKIIKDILQLSTDFEMEELKDICVEYLVKNLYLQNSLYFLNLAVEYKLHSIKEKCLNIICFNFTKITNDYLFLNLHEDLLMIILKSNYFKCFEYQILSGLLSWLKTYCVVNKIKINSIEYYNIIQKYFYFIRFNNVNESCLSLINFHALSNGCPNFVDKNFVIQNYLFKNNKSNRNAKKIIKTRYELACELKYYQRFTRINHIIINNKIKKFTDLYFMVNEQVYCYGFGILGPTENGVKLLPDQVVTVTLQNAEVSVVKIKKADIKYDGKSKTYDIMFEKPLLIKPFDYHYVVIDYDEQSAQLSGENVEHYVGIGCIEEEEIDGILIKYKVNCGKFGSTNAMSRLMSLILSKFEVHSDKRIENIYDYGTDVEIADSIDFDK